MKIDFSLLTGKIYVINGKNKTDITDDTIRTVQIMLHNKIEFKNIVSKLDKKEYCLTLKEINAN